MRYHAGQKTETHGRIVETAAREFRSKGLQGIGIADLMSRAGLTHGGFYAHFKGKDALVAEVSRCAAEESITKLLAAAESACRGKEIEAMLGYYLDPAHRDDPGSGCVLPALASELGRQSRSVRTAFTESLKRNMARIAPYMPGKGKKTKLAQAMTLVSGMAGAVLIARAINDPALSDLLLDSVRVYYSNLFRQKATR